MKIEGRTALVTGAARRVGRAIAIGLASRGARVAVHFRSSANDAEETVHTIRALDAEAEKFQCELTADGAPDALVRSVLDRFGSLDILVNSASVFGKGNLEESTPELWDEQMDTNARAPFFLARAASRPMLEAGCGKIVNLTDPAGDLIWPAYFAYSVSKAALVATTRGMARTLAPQIQVNAVAPGPVHFPEDYSDSQKRFAIDRTLLKRAGSTEDVVRAVIFLIENDYITGDVIHVDGGRHVM